MRYLTAPLEEILRLENKMVFISGPRQVGKTTLVQALLERVGESDRYFNWDNERHRKMILKNPDSFWTLSFPPPQGSAKVRLALDEIHKYPRWKRFLKGLFDVHRKQMECLVTGSGRLDVYQKGGDSLLGRYALFHLHPFTAREYLKPNRPVYSPNEFWNSVTQSPAPTGGRRGGGVARAF